MAALQLVQHLGQGAVGPGSPLTTSRRTISTGSRKAVGSPSSCCPMRSSMTTPRPFPGSAGYEWTRLLALPPQIRFVELLAIVGLAASLMIERRSITTAWLIGGCVIFSCLSALSYVNHSLVGSVDFARLVYMYLLPILVFVIARELRWRLSGTADRGPIRAGLDFCLGGGVMASVSLPWLSGRR